MPSKHSMHVCCHVCRLVMFAVMMQPSVGTLADRIMWQSLLYICPMTYQLAPYQVKSYRELVVVAEVAVVGVFPSSNTCLKCSSSRRRAHWVIAVALIQHTPQQLATEAAENDCETWQGQQYARVQP